MTPAGLAAELRSLGIGVRVVRGLPQLAPPPGGWPPLFAGSYLLADVTARRNAVLGEFGLAVEPCPLCCRWVCPRGREGIPDCDRRPLATAMIDATGVYATAENPPCPFGG